MASLGLIAGMWAEKFDQIAAFQSFYMIDGFRYGFFGQSDQPVELSFVVMLVAALLLTVVSVALLKRGYKLRDG